MFFILKKICNDVKMQNEKLCVWSEQEKPIYRKNIVAFWSLEIKSCNSQIFQNMALVIDYTLVVIDYKFKKLNI